MNNDNSNWGKYSLDKLGDYINGRAFKKDEWKDTGLPIIRIQNLNDSTANFNYTDQAHEQKYQIKSGDLLVSWSASLGVYFWDRGDAWLNQHIFKVIPNENLVTKEFLYFLLKSVLGELFLKTHGTGIVHITKGDFDSHEVYIPDISTQKTIVKKLNSILPLADSSHINIEQTKAKLAKFRQAVLSAAISGKLSESWREANPSKNGLEDAKKIFGNNLTKKLDEIPESWGQVPSEYVFSFVTSGSRGWAKYYTDVGSLFLRVGNLEHNSIGLKLDSTKKVSPPKGAEGSRTRVQPNDLIISITADVGRVALIPDEFEEAYINQHLALARPKNDFYVPFLAWYLATYQGGGRQFQELQRGATKVGLGLDDIKNIVIPFPPIEEQKEIVKKINTYFSVSEQVEKQLKNAEKKVGKLNQAILSKFF